MAKARRGAGEGAIFQRSNGYWVARIELPSPVGDRRRKEVTAKTKEALLAKLAEPRKQFYINGDLPSAAQPLSKWLTYWLDEVAAKRVRPNTLAGYRAVVTHINAAVGNIRLDKLAPAHVRRVHTHITAENSSTYALLAHRVLARALKDAEQEGLINRNVARLTDAPRKNRPDLHALTVDEAVNVIAQAIPNLDGRTEVYDEKPTRWATYLLTGMRRGELIGLEWDRFIRSEERDPETGEMVERWHIDLSWQLQRIADITTVPRDYEYRHIKGGLYWTRPKSNVGWRVIPLVEPLATILSRHRERAEPNPYGLVFSYNGNPIDPDAESASWRAARASLTDKPVKLHGLRHTTVDLLLEADVHEDVVMEIVGHSTRATTRSYKSRSKLTRRTNAMRQLSALLTP